jgi:hypothetical protein
MSTDRPLTRKPAEGGFAFALVVLLLFAIGVLGATGYQVVRTEFFQSQQATETGQALGVAEAGLAWFIGGQRGTVVDTTEYSLNGGTAVVTTRKVATLSDEEDLYLVTSEGTYTDPRYPQIPATRVVSQYTIYKKIPMRTLAPLMVTAENGVRVQDDGVVDGTDHASIGDCTGAPAGTLAGVVAAGNIQERSGGVITGSPEGVNLNNYDGVADSIQLAWDIYSDPDFPVDFDGSFPGIFWHAVYPDSFPVVRYDGDLTPRWWRHNGRGVLIIDGELRDRNNGRWEWDGIVIARDMKDITDNRAFDSIRGALVVGPGAAMSNTRLDVEEAGIYYHSCNVIAAGASLAHMEPVSNSWWEEGG